MAKLIHTDPPSTQIVLDLDKINIDEFTWGDLEDMESQSPLKIRLLMEKYATVDGIPKEKLGEFLRKLSLRQMRELSQEFIKAVMMLANPVTANGKN